jgi:hypothetical protein
MVVSRWIFAIYSGLPAISFSRALSLPAVAGEPFGSYAASIAYHDSCNRTHPVPSRERELPLDTRRRVLLLYRERRELASRQIAKADAL